MTTRKRTTLPNAENVLPLAEFRSIGEPRDLPSPGAIQGRAYVVRTQLERLLFDPSNPAVAASTTWLDAQGTMGVAAACIEPEMAPSFAHELRQLANEIEKHQRAGQKRWRQRGSAVLLALSMTGFACATYINDVAWIDVVLSCAAQAIALRFTLRRSQL